MLPESLNLGQRNLEDVFLELTGRGLVAVTRTFTPLPGAAPFGRQVVAQARMEARLLLRNGEQLLLAVVIPVIVLIGARHRVEARRPQTSRTPPSTSSRPASSPWR